MLSKAIQAFWGKTRSHIRIGCRCVSYADKMKYVKREEAAQRKKINDLKSSTTYFNLKKAVDPAFTPDEASQYLRAMAIPTSSTEAFPFYMVLDLEPISPVLKELQKDKNVIKGTVNLPHLDVIPPQSEDSQSDTSGRPQTWVIATGENAKIALECGADRVGGIELIREILAANQIEFNKLFCHENEEHLLRTKDLAILLGPKGLFPSARRGTVVKDMKAALSGMRKTLPYSADEQNDILSIFTGDSTMQNEHIAQNCISALRQIRDQTRQLRRYLNIKAVYLTSDLNYIIPLKDVLENVSDDTKKKTKSQKNKKKS